MNHLVYNAVKCDCCGKVIQSKFTHDYVKCGCDNETFVDGGLSYCRFGGKDMTKVISAALYENDPIESIREHMTWGQNYDKDKNLLPKTKWILIKDITEDHLEALIEYTKGMWSNNIFKREMEWRKNNY